MSCGQSLGSGGGKCTENALTFSSSGFGPRLNAGLSCSLGEEHLDRPSGVLINGNHEALPGPSDQMPVAPFHVGENVAGAWRECCPHDLTGRFQSTEIRPNP